MPQKVSLSRRMARACFSTLIVLSTLIMAHDAHAQVSLYAEGSASNLANSGGSNYLYGGTAGLLFDGPTFGGHVVASGDLQTRTVVKNGERLVGVGIGPRLSFRLKKLRLAPYAEFMVGFARYRDSTAPGALNTTDYQWQANAGVSKQISSRFDVVVDYSYSQYGANDGEYNPESFSAGAIFHFARR